MSSEPFAIEFRNVSISFEGKSALDDVSFTLESGHMICITGLSGSGKSVLLRLAAGEAAGSPARPSSLAICCSSAQIRWRIASISEADRLALAYARTANKSAPNRSRNATTRII